MNLTLLPHRAIIAVTGDDSAEFLQGLLTCDMDAVTHQSLSWGALLTPQGRLRHEFVIGRTRDGFLLETDRSQQDNFIRTLLLRRLRARVQCTPTSWRVAALWHDDDNGESFSRGTVMHQSNTRWVFHDVRLAALGRRVWYRDDNGLAALPQHGHADVLSYRDFRYRWAVMEGTEDYQPAVSLPLAYHMDHLRAVSLDKGCYMGQEVTARLHHRNALKQRVVSVEKLSGAWGVHPLLDERGASYELCCHALNWGLGLMPAKMREACQLSSDDGVFALRIPAWLEAVIADSSRH